MSKKSKILFAVFIIIASLAAGLTVTYIFGRDYFKTHFAFNTTVNGKDVSKQDMDQLLADFRAGYPTTFVITEKDGSKESFDFSETITNNDMDRFIEGRKVEAVHWYRSLFNETTFTASDKISVDEKKFKELAKNTLEEVKRTPSTDAYINNEEMQIVPETFGNEINVREACEKAYLAADKNVYEITLDEEYLLPEIYRDDPSLTSVLDEYEKLTDRKIRIRVADGLKETVGPKKLSKWISYDGKEFRFDEDGVWNYIVDLAVKYDTAWTERAFKTTGGRTIHVGRGAQDSYVGWLMNQEASFISLLQAVESDEGKKAEIFWDYAGYTLDKEANDIGGTYIEISIDDQHMWYYDDYKLMLDTDVVTGTETNAKRRTPRGLFYLLEMASPYVMHGDYGQQPCEYFIKVTWDGVAIHDADWQSAFGGNIYMYNGSHGCINTPHSVVAKLWDYLYEKEDWQMPVIIY